MQIVYACADCDLKIDAGLADAADQFRNHCLSTQHRSAGKIDLDSGEVIQQPNPWSVRKKKVKAKKGGSEPPAVDSPPPAKQVKAIEASIPPTKLVLTSKFHVLYDLARAKFPQYQKPMAEWIWDCTFGYYKDHAKELGLEEIFTREEQESVLAALKQ